MVKINIKIWATGVILLAIFVMSGCQPAATFIGQEAVAPAAPSSGGSELKRALPPLQIRQITPAHEATNVAPDFRVAVDFSEAVDPATISKENISLHYINPDLKEDQENISFSTALDTDGRRLELVPAQNYLAGETVEVVFSCGVKSRHEVTLVRGDDSFVNNVCYTSKFEVAP